MNERLQKAEREAEKEKRAVDARIREVHRCIDFDRDKWMQEVKRREGLAVKVKEEVLQALESKLGKVGEEVVGG